MGGLRSAGVAVPVRARPEPLSVRVVNEEKREGLLWARHDSEPSPTLLVRDCIVEFRDVKGGQ